MNYQNELEKLINDIAPPGILEAHQAWLEENTAFLGRRLDRLKRIKTHLERLPKLTRKEKTFLNRFKGRIVRITHVHQHREYLLFLARARRKSNP